MPKKDDRFNKILDMLGRPGAAVRAGVHEAQDSLFDDPMASLRAAKEQLGRPSSEAPSGADIVDRMNLPEDQVAAQAGLASLIDLTDPTPLGKIAKGAKALPAMAAIMKGAKKIKGGDRALSKVGNISFPAKSAAEALAVKEALARTGKASLDTPLQLGNKSPLQTKDFLLEKPPTLPSKEELRPIAEDLPNIMKDPRFRRLFGE